MHPIVIVIWSFICVGIGIGGREMDSAYLAFSNRNLKRDNKELRKKYKEEKQAHWMSQRKYENEIKIAKKN